MSFENYAPQVQPIVSISSAWRPDEALPAQPQKGIDIRQALDILSSRASNDHVHGHYHSSHDGCCMNVPEEAKVMGQTIDLNQQSNFSEALAHREAQELSQSLEKTQKQLEELRGEREIDLRAKLESMSIRELLQTVVATQEGRVLTYREYDRGLEIVLKTGNMSNYPEICVNATASFSVLSETIKTIDSILALTHKRNDLSGLLQSLQNSEREKLNLTAALHLEKFRFNGEAQGESTDDNRAAKLFSEGILALKQRVHKCVDCINEVLEELRCAIEEEVDK